jgi:DNA-binding response OmpR family regulator
MVIPCPVSAIGLYGFIIVCILVIVTVNFYLMDQTSINTQKKIVLVADDDNDLLQLVKIQLQRAGFDVQISLNGNGIMKMAVDGHPDVILLDIAMDGISGGDICKKLKTYDKTAAIPVIMISANDNIEYIANACGANDYVRKPFNVQAIKEKISRFVN